MEFSLLSGLLNTEIVYMTAGFQLLHQPARLLATTGPGLRRMCLSEIKLAHTDDEVRLEMA
jgi:hypothetical protein